MVNEWLHYKNVPTEWFVFWSINANGIQLSLSNCYYMFSIWNSCNYHVSLHAKVSVSDSSLKTYISDSYFLLLPTASQSNPHSSLILTERLAFKSLMSNSGHLDFYNSEGISPVSSWVPETNHLGVYPSIKVSLHLLICLWLLFLLLSHEDLLFSFFPF